MLKIPAGIKIYNRIALLGQIYHRKNSGKNGGKDRKEIVLS